MNKHITTLLIALFVTTVTMAQFAVNGSNGQGGTIEAYDSTGRPLGLKENGHIEGSPFLCPDWCSGSVLFANGKTANLPLRFDLEKNKVYFQQDGKFYEFVDELSAFQIKVQGADSTVRTWKFRKGYDPRAGKKGDAFYQVLEDGPKVHVLYHTYAGLVDNYRYGGPEKQIYQVKQELYVFDPVAGTLSKVRPTTKDVQDALPSCRNEVKAWLAQHPGSMDKAGLFQLARGLNATAR